MTREEQLIKEDNIFLLSETDNYSYYICKGLSKKVYEIIYNKQMESFNCSCRNVRLQDCYHIKAIRILQDENAI